MYPRCPSAAVVQGKQLPIFWPKAILMQQNGETGQDLLTSSSFQHSHVGLQQALSETLQVMVTNGGGETLLCPADRKNC
ncbi:unnamed protein product [Caretta caretta]